MRTKCFTRERLSYEYQALSVHLTLKAHWDRFLKHQIHLSVQKLEITFYYGFNPYDTVLFVFSKMDLSTSFKFSFFSILQFFVFYWTITFYWINESTLFFLFSMLFLFLPFFPFSLSPLHQLLIWQNLSSPSQTKVCPFYNCITCMENKTFAAGWDTNSNE